MDLMWSQTRNTFTLKIVSSHWQLLPTKNKNTKQTTTKGGGGERAGGNW